MNPKDFNFDSVGAVLPEIKLDAIDIDAILDIDINDLETSLRNQAVIYCAFGLLAREAEHRALKTKRRLETLEYQIQTDLQIRYQVEGGRLTKEVFERAYRQSPDWQKLTEEIDNLQHAAKVIATMEDSLNQRYGMALQIAKRRTSELAQLN